MSNLSPHDSISSIEKSSIKSTPIIERNYKELTTVNMADQTPLKKTNKQQIKKIIKFGSNEYKNLSIEDKLDQMIKHLKKKETRSYEEAEKYYVDIRENILKLIERSTFSSPIISQQMYEDLKGEKIILERKIEKQEEELAHLRQNIEKQRKTIEDKDIELQQLKTELNHQFPVQILDKFNKLFETIPNQKQESELNKNNISVQSLREDLNNLLLSIENQKKQIYELTQNNQQQQEYIIGSLATMEKEQELSKKIDQQDIKLDKILEYLNKSKGSLDQMYLEAHAENTNEFTATEENKAPSYSSIAQRAPKRKTIPILSTSAILLTRKPTTKMTINNIKEIVDRELRKERNLPKLFSSVTRDRNSLLIKSTADKEVDAILNSLQTNENILSLLELKYLGEKRKKIIILGIPNYIDEEEVIENIEKEIGQDVKENSRKTISRPKSKSYQLMIELEEPSANLLLSQARLHISLASCRITNYAPIIRCNNCQLFGHTQDKCRRQQTCAYCMNNHNSSTCPNKDNPSSHRCINCLHTIDNEGRPYNNQHSANSNQCYVFKDRFNERHYRLNISTSSRSRN